MKRDLFIQTVNQYKATNSKLHTVSFIARSTQIGLKYSYDFTTAFWDTKLPRSLGRILYDFCSNPMNVYETYVIRAKLPSTFNHMCLDLSDQSDILINNIKKFKHNVS